MRFYLVLLLVLILQSSVLVGVFGSYLFVPDLLLCLLFLSSVRDKTDYAKGFFGALLLDLLQDSLGWHASGKLLALFLLDMLKKRFYIESLSSLIIGYMVIAVLEHTYRYVVFRIKYYYPIDFHLLSISFLIEAFVVYYFGRRLIRYKNGA
ncbi:rod shape-determining protein MreD [Thermocrinis sp.]